MSRRLIISLQWLWLALSLLLLCTCLPQSPSERIPAATTLTQSSPDVSVEEQEITYRIDFSLNTPTISRLDNQHAIITGNLLNNDDLTSTNRIYTITLALHDGPATGETVLSLPPLASRGPTTFANRVQPEIVAQDGTDVLAIRLLGLIGDRSNEDGRGLTFYRGPSSRVLVRLTVGERYTLSNVRYTLTNIDALLGATPEETCLRAEPNNIACGGSFIDQVTILSDDGDNIYLPADADHISLNGNVITARFLDADQNGHPDTEFDARIPLTSTNGDVAIIHPTHIGTTLQFEFGDAGVGLDSDPDDYHDFDAPEQAIGLASGITFNLKELPPPTPNPNFTTITGFVFGDENHNKRLDHDERGLADVIIGLYSGEGVGLQTIMTTTTSLTQSQQGLYELHGIQAAQPYRLEAWVTTPQLADDGTIKPIRLIRTITPNLAGPNVVNFPAWPHQLETTLPQNVDDLTGIGFLLPDLQPLTHYPLPDDLPETVRADIENDYPGLEKWYLDRDTELGRTLLRFGTLALNRGSGPLHILGGSARVLSQSRVSGVVQPVYQRLYMTDGAFIQKRVGTFIYHEGHEHVHMEAFEQYNLRDLETDEVVRSSGKMSFCLTDVLWSAESALDLPPQVATVPRGWECGADEQSINVGYSDYYGPELADQWIDVTDLPSGPYWLEIVVNPENRLMESDTTNNRVRIQINLMMPMEEVK